MNQITTIMALGIVECRRSHKTGPESARNRKSS